MSTLCHNLYDLFINFSQFTYEKKYPAEGHKFLNNLRFLMIRINFKK